MAETKKAHQRRLKEGFFKTYAPDDLSGIDIGCQQDPLNFTFRRWDLIFGDGDATHMKGVPDEKYQTVYASHVLEHIEDVSTALRNWWRILKPTGHLIVVVPHRDLYERPRKQIPSRWNGDHKWMFLPDRAEPPSVLNFKDVIEEVPGQLVSYRVLDQGWVAGLPDNQHSGGEYSIEAIVKKV